MDNRIDKVTKMIPFVIVLASIFNFDQYLEVGRILLFQVLPVVLVLLTMYTIWGIINDMKSDEDETELERQSRLEEV